MARDETYLQAAAADDYRDWLAWLELGGKAPATLDAYERTVAALLLVHPDLTFSEFTDSHLLRFLLAFPEKSRRIRKAHLASWFRWGYKARRITSNPVELLPEIKKHAAKVPALFSEGEIAALEALPLIDGALMCLLIEGGLRRKEARSLTAQRLDFENRLILLTEGTKGSKPRTVPMVAVPTAADPEGLRLARALANLTLLEGLNPADHLWYIHVGGPNHVLRRSQVIGDSSISRWWSKCLEAAGVEYRNIHATRHTYATRWRRAGLTTDDLAVAMGHASSETTSEVYDHTTVYEVAARMAAVKVSDR